jgi:hypothetical protein
MVIILAKGVVGYEAVTTEFMQNLHIAGNVD